jgi:sugar lactone lactonase YvrE
MRARVIAEAGCDLGEGPWWDRRRERLLFLDIKAGAVYSWSQTDGVLPLARFDGLVGFAIPRGDGGLVVGVDRRLQLVEEDGTISTVAEVEPELPGNRFNDAKCDPAGRLWAGTMSIEREPGVAALYRLEPNGRPEPVLAGLTISNGIGWSPDRETMYLIDSPTQRIDAFDFDLAAGTIANRRPFATIEPADGLPDGLAVDAEGGVWAALFGGGVVRRYRSDGSLDLALHLPTSNPTCPAFGGSELRELFVTTARHKLGAADLTRQPLAGALFGATAPHPGLPLTPFAG